MPSNSQQTQNTDTEGAVTRKSVRKNAGRNPTRFIDDAQQTLGNNSSKSSPNAKVICGKTDCGKTIDEGIECSNCLKWYHPSCGGLTTGDFRDHKIEDDKLWFCQDCGSIPIFRLLTTIIKRQERQISMLEKRLSAVESAKPQMTQTFAERVESAFTTTVPITEPNHNESSKEQKSSQNTSNHNNQCSVLKKNTEDLTVICSNLPEPTATSLKARHEEEVKSWQTICEVMGLNIQPASLTRLSRPRSSPHAGEPRLLRVTLKNMKDVEAVLLSSHLLRKESIEARIFPDIPWSERQKSKKDPKTARINRSKRTLMIHGIPESSDDNEWSKRENDRREWNFVQELLGMKDILTTGLTRIPHSPKYQGSGPRILKVSLLNEIMVDTLVESWNFNKRILPPELKLRTFSSLKQRSDCENHIGPRVDHTQDNSSDSSSKNQIYPKNAQISAPTESN